MAAYFCFFRRSAPAAVLASLFFLVSAFPAESFQCNNSGATCNALVDYISPNATSLAAILSLFNITTFTSFLGANGFSLSTPTSQNVSAGQILKIPFPCICTNGTGLSNHVPVYTVNPGDGLYHIAAEVFSGLVTYPDIQMVNNISDANLIEVGQELWIPIPCSCDDVGGKKVVHYGYLVPNGSTVDGIANQFGTTGDTLASLNGLAGPNDLKAGSIIDVPLRACDSMIAKNSLDYPLLVPNGSYALTANDCVKCDCDSANYWMLQCSPSQIKQSSNMSWGSCPNMTCDLGTKLSPDISLVLGNRSDCRTCTYAGYYSQFIAAVAEPNSNCSAPTDKSLGVRTEGSWMHKLPILMLFHVLFSYCHSLL